MASLLEYSKRRGVKVMNVVYTFDNGYSVVTAVSMVSLLENNKNVKNLKIYIVDCGISDINKKRFTVLANKYGRALDFVDGKNFESRIPIKLDLGYWSFVCYVRLFFCELFPELEKVMHVDCDTLILKSLEDAYNLDIGENLCAGCYDCVPTPKYSAVFSEDCAYYSNGFLIFDLDKMRKDNVQEKFVDYIVKRKGELPHLDQDVVNAVLKDKIYTLPPEYNVMTQICLFKEKEVSFFEESEPYYKAYELVEACANPVIIHFVGFRFVSRPWNQPCYHPYNFAWIEYYKMINGLFGDNGKILEKKKKKYGIFREIACFTWNLGYKIPRVRELEIFFERKKVKNKCKLYKNAVKKMGSI